MIKFNDEFQYQIAGQNQTDQQMKEMDNEKIHFLFSEAKRVINAVQCKYDVTVTFRGTSSRHVIANIKGEDTDVTKVYKSMEWWFKKNQAGVDGHGSPR